MRSSPIIDSRAPVSNESVDAEAGKEEFRAVCYTGIFIVCIVLAIVAAAVSVLWHGVQELLALG